jgi:hypothetical protein
MAKADSILVNHNKIIKDTKAVDEFIDWHLFENKLIKNKHLLLKNAISVKIDERYDYRPDRLAYEHYRQDFYFPAILIANNLGSMLQFKAEILDYRCLMPSANVIQSILGEPTIKKANVGQIVDNIFKDVNKSVERLKETQNN